MDAALKELAHREQDGIAVTLLWNAKTNEVSIQLVDQRIERDLAFTVANDAALDAFAHPFAYAPSTADSPELSSTTSTEVWA
jgi:hypothetical protein